MKAGVVIAIAAVNNAGNDVLAGMLLHQVKPPVPIDAAFYHIAHRQRPVAQMDHRFSPLLHIQHLRTAEDTNVAGLSAAFGVKCRGIQRHFIAIRHRFAGDNGGTKLRHHAVFII